MNRILIFTALLAVLPFVANAAGLERPVARSEITDPIVDLQPALIFNIRTGVGVAPAYFGANTYVTTPNVALGFEFLRLPKGKTFGSEDPSEQIKGFTPRGSLRIVRARTAEDNPELTGLNDVDLTVELGLGAAYRQRNFRAFADARYGVLGHNSWVGDLGADLLFYPNDRLKMSLGPRVFLGDSDYTNTYFGVSVAEAAASGLSAFSAGGGLLSTGVELGATYRINENWGLSGVVRWEQLLNDAEASPITALGDPNQFTVRIGAVRRFSLRY